MTTKKLFSSSEECDKYNNYVIVNTGATRSYHTTDDAILGRYHTRKQAERELTRLGYFDAEVMTRRQAVNALDYMREEQIRNFGESFIKPTSL